MGFVSGVAAKAAVITCLFLPVASYAEKIECKQNGDIPKDRQVSIQIERSSHSLDGFGRNNLYASAKRGRETLAYRTQVQLSRHDGKIYYHDVLYPHRSFQLFLDANAFLNSASLQATLMLDVGTRFESRIDDLTCSVDGKPVKDLAPCPSNEKSRQKLLVGVAKAGSLTDMKELLGCGGEINFTDKNKCSLLHFITDVNCGLPDYTSGRTTHPADPRSPAVIDHKGRGVLFEEEFIRVLAAQGADLDLADKRGQTALINATRNHERASVMALIELGASTDIQNSEGMTALMIAALTGEEMLVRILLDGNPDLTIKNKAGKTALDLAVERGHEYLAGLLTPKSKGSEEVVIGSTDGTCSPTMVHLQANKDVEIVLKAESDKMFLLEAPDLGLELMAMPNSEDRKTIHPTRTGNFPFTCGVHGGPPNEATKGTFMVM